MRSKHLNFLEASELLMSKGYTLLSKVNFSYAYHHPNTPRQKIIVIPSDKTKYSEELTNKIYDAIKDLETTIKEGEK